jgi:hypothetical protein
MHAIAALLLTLLGASSGFACSTPPTSHIKRNPREAFDRAVEVLVAKAVSVEQVDDYLSRITFEVRAVLKGSEQRHRTVIQNRGLGCEFTPRLGFESLFFLSAYEGAYSVRQIGEPEMSKLLGALPSPVWRADEQ